MVSSSCSTTSTVLPRLRRLLERTEKPVVVARMQTDGRFVENVQHAAKARTDLRGQANALRFAAGERGGRAIQAEIAETDGQQKIEALGDLFQRPAGNLSLARRELRQDLVDGGARRAQRQRREIRDGPSGQLHGQRFRTQALAVANGAQRGGHVLRHPLAIRVGVGFLKVALQEFQNAGEAKALVRAFLLVGAGRLLLRELFIRRRIAVQQEILDAWRKLLERRLEVEAVSVGGQLQRALEHRGAGAGSQAAIEQRPRPVDDDARRIEIVFRAETVASGTRAVRRIEAEGARFQYGNGDAAIRAGQLLGKNVVLAAHDRDRDQTAGQLQRGGDGLFQAGGDPLLDQQAIDHDLNGVILALVENRRFVERNEFAIDARADVAVLRELLQLLAIGAFAPANDGRQDHDAVVGLAEIAVQDGLDDLLAGLARDGLAAIRAMRNADRAVDHAQVVVNLRDGADRGARGARGGLLLDGDRGRKSFNHIDFGAFHLIEELAGVGRKGLHVAALALGIDGVKRERRLAGTGQAR